MERNQVSPRSSRASSWADNLLPLWTFATKYNVDVEHGTRALKRLKQLKGVEIPCARCSMSENNGIKMAPVVVGDS